MPSARIALKPWLFSETRRCGRRTACPWRCCSPPRARGVLVRVVVPADEEGRRDPRRRATHEPVAGLEVLVRAEDRVVRGAGREVRRRSSSASGPSTSRRSRSSPCDSPRAARSGCGDVRVEPLEAARIASARVVPAFARLIARGRAPAHVAGGGSSSSPASPAGTAQRQCRPRKTRWERERRGRASTQRSEHGAFHARPLRIDDENACLSGSLRTSGRHAGSRSSLRPTRCAGLKRLPGRRLLLAPASFVDVIGPNSSSSGKRRFARGLHVARGARFFSGRTRRRGCRRPIRRRARCAPARSRVARGVARRDERPCEGGSGFHFELEAAKSAVEARAELPAISRRSPSSRSGSPRASGSGCTAMSSSSKPLGPRAIAARRLSRGAVGSRAEGGGTA